MEGPIADRGALRKSLKEIKVGNRKTFESNSCISFQRYFFFKYVHPSIYEVTVPGPKD